MSILYGMLLSDGSLRMNGRHALLSIQQIDYSLVYDLWCRCKDLQLVAINLGSLTRPGRQIIYYFQTFTLPLFTRLFQLWYTNVNGKI